MSYLFRWLAAGLLVAGGLSAQAQTTATPAASPAPALPPPDATVAAKAAQFGGAPATRAHYRAVYQLDSDDPKLITKTLHNMQNALNDPRLKGKLELELVVFSQGLRIKSQEQPLGYFRGRRLGVWPGKYRSSPRCVGGSADCRAGAFPAARG